jgi:hypothetical protein
MKYSKIREYISQTITSYDSDFQEHNEAFNSENIAKSRFDKGFFIEYSIPSITTGPETAFTSNASATIQFSFKGFRCPRERLDDSMDIVGEISQLLASVKNVFAYRVTDDFPIQNVFPTSQVPEPLENNDNAILINLELDLSIMLSSC